MGCEIFVEIQRSLALVFGALKTSAMLARCHWVSLMAARSWVIQNHRENKTRSTSPFTSRTLPKMFVAHLHARYYPAVTFIRTARTGSAWPGDNEQNSSSKHIESGTQLIAIKRKYVYFVVWSPRCLPSHALQLYRLWLSRNLVSLQLSYLGVRVYIAGAWVSGARSLAVKPKLSYV